jgi:hypothetical protein
MDELLTYYPKFSLLLRKATNRKLKHEILVSLFDLALVTPLEKKFLESNYGTNFYLNNSPTITTYDKKGNISLALKSLLPDLRTEGTYSHENSLYLEKV